MTPVTLTIATKDTHAALDRFEVFGNDGSGGAVDYNDPITADPVPLFPESRGTVPVLGWLAAPWLESKWFDGGPPVVLWTSKELYFGAYRFGVRAMDAIGNVQGGAAAEVAITVNSDPRPPRELRHTGQSGTVAIFSFVPGKQMR